MSPFDVGRLTLAQAVYYLREKASQTKSISRTESRKLQKNMTNEQKLQARRKVAERIAFFTGSKPANKS